MPADRDVGMASDPVVSVVVPARDVEDSIGAQLAALARQDFAGEWEIIVADNGSRDRTSAVVEAWRDRLPIRLVDAAGSAGAGYARNVGVAAARADLLAFCDADDEVRPDWLSTMVRALERSPLVAGAIDHTRLNSPASAAAYSSWGPGTRWCDFLPGATTANLGVRRAVFDDVGGFPVGYRNQEDTWFCWRAQLAGYVLALEPAAIVDRRLKRGPWRSFLHHVRHGLGTVRMYEAFREHGMKPQPLREVLYDYMTVIVFIATGRHHRAARVAGWHLGRLLGSIRARVLFL